MSATRRARRRARSPIDVHRWTVSYADLVTLLLAFFVGLYSLAASRARAEDEAPTPPVEPAHCPQPQVVLASMPELEPESVDAREPEPEPEPESVDARDCSCENDDATETEPVSAVEPIDPAVTAEAARRAALKSAVDALVGHPLLKGSVHVSLDHTGIRLSLGSSLLFKAGDQAVRDRAHVAIAQIAHVLSSIPGDITVEGHTDNVPVRGRSYRSNWELSTARATEVLGLLVEDYGIDPSRLSAAGYGQYRPVATNETAQGRALNRRIDIVFSTRHLPTP